MLKRLAVFNEPSTCKIDTRYLMEITGGDKIHCRINLKSTRMSVINEPSTQKFIDNRLLMQVTGNDTITVRSLYKKDNLIQSKL